MRRQWFLWSETDNQDNKNGRLVQLFWHTVTCCAVAVVVEEEECDMPQARSRPDRCSQLSSIYVLDQAKRSSLLLSTTKAWIWWECVVMVNTGLYFVTLLQVKHHVVKHTLNSKRDTQTAFSFPCFCRCFSFGIIKCCCGRYTFDEDDPGVLWMTYFCHV